MTIKSTSLDDLLKKVNLTKGQYQKELFDLTNVTYSLYESTLIFLDHAEDNKDKILLSRGGWMGFISNFYDNYNFMKNTMRWYLEGKEPKIEEVKESFDWIHTALKGVFYQDRNQKPYSLDAIVAGKIYLTFFFHMKNVENYISEKLSIYDEIDQNKKIIEMTNNEYEIIKKLEKEVLEKKDRLHEVERESQVQLLGMWERTLDFVHIYLEKVNKSVNNQIKSQS